MSSQQQAIYRTEVVAWLLHVLPPDMAADIYMNILHTSAEQEQRVVYAMPWHDRLRLTIDVDLKTEVAVSMRDRGLSVCFGYVVSTVFVFYSFEKFEREE